MKVLLVLALAIVAQAATIDKDTLLENMNVTLARSKSIPLPITACWRTISWRVPKQRHHCEQGERSGMLCYPECSANETGFGSECIRADGSSYSRGRGIPLGCLRNETLSENLCLPNCPDSTVVKKDRCLAFCPADISFSCGSLCTRDRASCVWQSMRSFTYVGKIVRGIANLFNKIFGRNSVDADVYTLISEEAESGYVVLVYGIPLCADVFQS